jgi:hypothetical protein
MTSEPYRGIPGLYRSDAVGELMQALAAAQPKFAPIMKERTAEVISRRTGGRYTYAYADLADVLDAVRPALAEHGIALIQCPIEAEGQAGAFTVIAKGEQWVGVSMLVPYDPTLGAQGKGSAVTYARRYGLTALLGVAARGEDDDAVAVTPAVQSAEPKPEPPTPPPPPTPTPPTSPRLISEPQRKRLYAIAKATGWTDEEIRAKLIALGFSSSREIPVSRYDEIVQLFQSPDAAAIEPAPDAITPF